MRVGPNVLPMFVGFAIGVVVAVPIAVLVVRRRQRADARHAYVATPYRAHATGYPAGQNVAYAADDIQYVDTSD